MKKNILCLLLIAAAMTACKEPNIGSKGGGQHGRAYTRVIECIDNMARGEWNKEEYEKIASNQIPKLKTNADRNSAKAYLEAEYSKQLVREAKKSFDEGCKDNKYSHDLQKNLVDELERYPKVPGRDEVMAMHSLHNEVAGFISSAVGRQYVAKGDYSTHYDKSHETTQMAKAKTYLANSSVKCQSQRKSLENYAKNNAYSSRRKAFCEKIVDHYSRCNSPIPKEMNLAIAALNSAQPEGEKYKAQIRELNDSIKKAQSNL